LLVRFANELKIVSQMAKSESGTAGETNVNNLFISEVERLSCRFKDYPTNLIGSTVDIIILMLSENNFGS
jgi:hypothetical protein